MFVIVDELFDGDFVGYVVGAGTYGPELTMARVRETDAADPLCCAETNVTELRQSNANARTFSTKR